MIPEFRFYQRLPRYSSEEEYILNKNLDRLLDRICAGVMAFAVLYFGGALLAWVLA